MPLADDIMSDVEDCINGEVRAIATSVFQEVRDRTPILTGLARYSWIPEVGFSLQDPAPVDPATTSPFAQAARQQAGAIIIGSWKLGDGDIQIVNAVPYIVELNSEPPHAGFLDIGIMAGVARARAS